MAGKKAKKSNKKKAGKKAKKVIASKKARKKYLFEARRFAPLKASFLFASMMGFLFSVLIVRKWDLAWAAAFAIFFALMFIASLISMAWASPDSELAPR